MDFQCRGVGDRRNINNFEIWDHIFNTSLKDKQEKCYNTLYKMYLQDVSYYKSSDTSSHSCYKSVNDDNTSSCFANDSEISICNDNFNGNAGLSYNMHILEIGSNLVRVEF